MTPMVEPVEDTPSCTTCNDRRTVPGWVLHDGSDFPDKRWHQGKAGMPCPDCTHGGPKG